jgi:hypothetical protein
VLRAESDAGGHLPGTARNVDDTPMPCDMANDTATAASCRCDTKHAPLADIDALCEHLSGRLVVQVLLDEDRRRTYVRGIDTAERSAARATERGQLVHVSLVRMVPVGVVTELTSPELPRRRARPVPVPAHLSAPQAAAELRHTLDETAPRIDYGALTGDELADLHAALTSAAAALHEARAIAEARRGVVA